jgi:DNA anti-recombination protein RmuC
MTVYNSIEEAVKDTNAAINEIAKLQAENAKLNREYIKVWEVLRTYNPSDIELKYIGFEDVK